MSTKTLDDKSSRLNKARKSVSDSTMLQLESIAHLEEVIAEENYQRGFDDGVRWVKDEFQRLSGSNDEEPVAIKPYEPTEIDRLVQETIVSHITDNPGLRASDITNKVITLPVKPALTEKSIRLAINRLKNSSKIEDKAGRWYVKGAKPTNQAYQVMTYLPDGSKYLGADILK